MRNQRARVQAFLRHGIHKACAGLSVRHGMQDVQPVSELSAFPGARKNRPVDVFLRAGNSGKDIFVVSRSEAMIDHVLSFFLEAVTVIVWNAVFKVDQIIKVFCPDIFCMNVR